MKRKFSGSKGFALLFADVFALNMIILLLPFAATPLYSQFIVFNNLSWLLSNHICEHYARNKKGWVRRLMKATASGFSLLLLLNWALYSTTRPYQNPHIIVEC